MSQIDNEAAPNPSPPPAVAPPTKRISVQQPIAIVALVGAFLLGALIAGSIVAGVATAGTAKPKPATFSAKAAYDKALTGCGMTQVADGVDLSDAGKTLTLDGEGNDSDGLAYDKEFCVLKALKMPDAIKQDMGQTRALDGAQNAHWTHFDVTWRYHPDDGLDAIITASK